MSRGPVTIPKHQAGDPVTARDLNAVQANVDVALRQISALRLVTAEPQHTSSPGRQGDVWMSSNGTVKVCLADNVWARFVGVSF